MIRILTLSNKPHLLPDAIRSVEQQSRLAGVKHIVEIDDGSIDLDLTGFNRHELELSMTAVHQEDAKHSRLRENFAGNYGADKDTGDDDPAPTGDKFPVTLILSREEHEKWQTVKNRLKIQGDKTAFLKIIGG